MPNTLTIALLLPLYAFVTPVVYRLLQSGSPIVPIDNHAISGQNILDLPKYCPPKPATPAEQAAIFDQFVETFYGKLEAQKAFDRHMVGEAYIQHNPDILQGNQAALDDFLVPLFNAGVNITLLNTFFGNNRGLAHHRSTDYRAEKPWYIMDIYRFEGTCIMEHWDVMQHLPENAINPLAML